ncbi:Protein FAM161A [Triplophysa tibetana]|uniref:Protein FAM161A n=1 Tax=Triplophysa tibetana TaxID=1572043 RepID=A0A5A9PLJ7_9TELE|nr:Protein FAM161A [Triplophysa tibetana]
MEKCHRANVLVTSCLKTPVDPHTKVPLALYERERTLPCAAAGFSDNRDNEMAKEMEYDSGSDLVDHDSPTKDSNRLTGDNIDIRQLYFSNQEYYYKLEKLKRAHLHTMAELEHMYRKKLELNKVTPGKNYAQTNYSHQGMLAGSLKKAQSALELRRNLDLSDTYVEEHIADDGQGDRSIYNTEKGFLSSPKEQIKNMWQDFRVKKRSPPQQHPFSSSLLSLPDDTQANAKVKAIRKKRKQARDGGWQPRVTVPKPFQVTLREVDRRKKGIKSRSEIERENADLRRQLEELTECQRKFRASPVPAHVRLPLYEELHERDEDRRRLYRATEAQRLHASQRPFSFSERELLKKEQKEAKLREQMLLQDKEEEERRKCPFKAKPVPRAVKEAALGDQQKEEELYRAIKMQMRARELFHSASMPPSMLAQRISERQAQQAAQKDKPVHRPKINTNVPDFDASYRKFQKQLENRRDVRPLTACEPFKLRTSTIASHKERIMADIEVEKQSQRSKRWPFVSTPALYPMTPSSSLCSSLSGSQEYLPAKITDAAKKRQEAVRKVIEKRKKAEDEEEKWRETQKQREKKLQKVISKRAQANDPHVALAQTCQSKLKDFRKQEMQRRREYQEEMRGIQKRVKGRPLLLEQVAQMNAKRAAEKLYSDTLHGCGLNESFVNRKVPEGLKNGQETQSPACLDGQAPPAIRNEEYEEFGSLHHCHLDDYLDDYEEYDHEMEEDHMDQHEDYKPDEDQDSDEEKEGDEGRSFDDELDFEEDDNKDDDIIRKRSQSSRGSEIDNSHHSNISRSGSIALLVDEEKQEDQKIDYEK